MHLETKNQAVLEHVRAALHEIDLYKQSREYGRLKVARAALDHATTLDPEYIRALYYSAIVDDLIGKPQRAIESFRRVLDESPPFVDEVRYNLAVAHYHRYNWENLEEAIENFKHTINSAGNVRTRVLARMGLAQAYAMRMVSRDPRSAEVDEILRYFHLCTEEAHWAEEELVNAVRSDDTELAEARWRMPNARGMALMYHSDYFGSRSEKIVQLRRALKELEEANRLSPQNWANYCDMGSVHMRLGHWMQSEDEFRTALRYLDDVVRDLRPNYGFALYEIGRAYRLMGWFSEALEYLNRSRTISYEERTVSDRRVDLEIKRAELGSREYP